MILADLGTEVLSQRGGDTGGCSGRRTRHLKRNALIKAAEIAKIAAGMPQYKMR